jgi:hypothetical protein
MKVNYFFAFYFYKIKLINQFIMQNKVLLPLAAEFVSVYLQVHPQPPQD